MYYGQDLDYEPPEDPLLEEAEILADLQLEAIQDDLDDEAYQKLWQETKAAEYQRLVAERAAEIIPEDKNIPTGSIPDDEMIEKILRLLGVDPADWSVSLSGIYAAIRSNMQIGEPHMTTIEDWTDADAIPEDTLTAVMFKLVERAGKDD